MNKTTIQKIKRWGRFALEAAPVIVGLNRHSHPIAWLAAAAHLVDKAGHLTAKKAVAAPNPWPGLLWQQRRAVVNAMVDAGVGEVVDVVEGMEIRSSGGVTFGSRGDSWVDFTLTAGAAPAVCVADLWERRSCLVVGKSPPGDTTLSADGARACMEPSARVDRLAADCAAMKAAGMRVGLLLDGAPGTGKSQALLYIASVLGGRTVRASMQSASPADVTALAIALGATAVILDDIDRGPSDVLLDAVDLLGPSGAAILASSNESAAICDALLREGRIDDRHTMGPIEPDVLERLAPRLNGEDIDALSRMTVAAVTRYLDIRDTLGRERALNFLRREAT